MNPAFSVILFTTLSGAGYGLLAWTGGFILFPYLQGRAPHEGVLPAIWAVLLLAGFSLTSIGLVSSLFHLGKPSRSWRAFSQWRTSWLSREGVLAVLTMATITALLGMILAVYFKRSYAIVDGPAVPILASALMLLALGTVVCTAMIYASLKTIPAWRHRLVAPVYLLFALQAGGLIFFLAFCTIAGSSPELPSYALAILSLLSLTIAVNKLAYWRAIDCIELPSRESATALEGIGTVTTFERPHTEANYLTNEMGFVLARKHSRKLRIIALLLFAGIPLLALLIAALLPATAGFALWIAALAALAGAFVERWLFFAEAKHMVMLYY
jgi:DMSO reductase anchor subunit